jgi:uncharacterized protein (DUF1810 family)
MGYDINRFLEAQEHVYEAALSELVEGRKQGHWIWYIFPQLRGLGTSRNSVYYGLADVDEARAYLAHPLLGQRYQECIEAVHHAVVVQRADPLQVMGSEIDVLKLCSSVDLFLQVVSQDTPLALKLTELRGQLSY